MNNHKLFFFIQSVEGNVCIYLIFLKHEVSIFKKNVKPIAKFYDKKNHHNLILDTHNVCEK